MSRKNKERREGENIKNIRKGYPRRSLGKLGRFLNMFSRNRKGKPPSVNSIITNSIENQSLPPIPTISSRNHKNTNQGVQRVAHQKPTSASKISTTLNAAKNSQTIIIVPHDNEEQQPEPHVESKQRTFQTNLPKRTAKPYSPLDPDSSDEESTSSSFVDLNEIQNIYLPKLQPSEAEFLQLVADNDVNGVQNVVQKSPGFNINCTNHQGTSALHIAVKNGSEAMVECLQTFGIEIGDTVLHAIRGRNLKILTMLLNALRKISPGLEFSGATHSNHFPDHLTPLHLAAQERYYEAVELLIQRGHTITRPHPPKCYCSDCKDFMANNDPLHAINARLSAYRAISSPAYLVHVSADPILAAFRLTAELAANAATYRQLAAAYLQLRDDVSTFAVALIGCCRTSEEVEIILKQTSGMRNQRHFVLPRLLMAVEYQQKEFVAHPNTQQVLEAYWQGDWHSWRRRSSVGKAFIITTRVLITPAILIMCMLAPCHYLVRRWQIPLSKLITHAAAYFVFLALVFFISNQDKRGQKRGPPNTGAEGPLVLFVLGYTWSAFRMCMMQGPRRYFSKMSNWVEVIMLFLFGLTFALWYIAAVGVNRSLEPDLERKYWDQYDPTLLAEGTFCLATIFAFFRLMYLCHLSYQLGPLQVSLGKMTIDIYKYIIVFAIIICAFAAGLARFYQYYEGMVFEDKFGMKTVQVSSFTSLRDTLNTLFWALFCMAPLESADVVLQNTNKTWNLKENRHSYTERVGYFCFGCFEVISVIVVLNMLIATMSSTFESVTDNVANEWTFGRTEVYVEYMMQTTLPSPYNLIPTASGIAEVFEWFRVKLFPPPGVRGRWSPGYCCYIERDVEANIQKEYPALICVLVQRYFCEVTASSTKERELRREIAKFVSLEKNNTVFPCS